MILKNLIKNLIFIALINFAFFSKLIFAESNTLEIQTSLSVNPSILEVILDENNSVQKDIVITNLSNLAQPIKASVQGFTQKERLELTEEEKIRFDSSSWIFINDDDKDFILQPNESKNIKLIITQPENATPGGHYATLYFQPLIPQELVSSESIFIYSRVAVLVFMQTKGDIIENLSIDKIDYNSITQKGNQKIDLYIKNEGNTHSQPVIFFKLIDETNNQTISEKIVNASIILPGTTKKIQIDNIIENYIGKYAIEISIKYNSDGNLIKSDRLSFYVFPIFELLFIVLPIVLALIIVLLLRIRVIKAMKILIGKGDYTENTKALKFKFKK